MANFATAVIFGIWEAIKKLFYNSNCDEICDSLVVQSERKNQLSSPVSSRQNNSAYGQRDNQYYNTEQYWKSHHCASRTVALDCEYKSGKKCIPHKVAIVDYSYNVIYEYDKQKEQKRISVVHDEVLKKITDCIVVGHGLRNDFKALNIYDHPKNDERDTCYVDTFQFSNLKRPKLSILAENYLGKIIQQSVPHDPVEDAQAAMELYRYIIEK